MFEPCASTDAHAVASACPSCRPPNPVPEAARHRARAIPQELALLAALEQACEALLARCFENYAQLAEAAPSGILEGGQAAPELPAPALLPAVELCNILRDALKPVDQARPARAACASAVPRGLDIRVPETLTQYPLCPARLRMLWYAAACDSACARGKGRPPVPMSPVWGAGVAGGPLPRGRRAALQPPRGRLRRPAALQCAHTHTGL